MKLTRNQFRNRLLFTLGITLIALPAICQEAGKPMPVYHFNGNVSVTNNGFSFIPLFSLGKPATVTNLSMGGDRFNFEPQFRFDLAGLKPWSFIFIWRYRVIQAEKFQLKVGIHLPAYSFRENTFQENGGTVTRLIPYRVMATELLPTYSVSSHISIGLYHLHGFAVEKFDEVRNIDFLSLRAFFSQLHLSKQFYLNWNPEVYYLNLAGVDGFYFASGISLGHQKIPVSLATTMNFKLKSAITSKDFDWNISLIYFFSSTFTRR